MGMSVICNKCGDVLGDDNWSPSFKLNHTYTCKTCSNTRSRLRHAKNKAADTEYVRNYRRSHGMLSMDENVLCSVFLGVHVAEGVLSKVFKDVERMPYGNPGYDFICNNGYLMDSKSSCMHIRHGKSPLWQFLIKNNTIADYFVLLAFDNRYDLEPLYIWMIPGNDINDHASIAISESTIGKWNEYRLDINKVVMCCDDMR